MLLSVIVPAYKQEKTIKEDLKRILETLSQTRWDFEIIAVDDGSPDKTLKKLKEINPPAGGKIIVCGYKTNRGKGYAVRYGMARAKGDLIAFIDSGMELDPNGISMLIEHMLWYEADIMIGSKRHPASKVIYPFHRKLVSFGAQAFARIFLGINVRDTQVGLKIFKRRVLEKVLPRLIIKRYAFDMEMLAVARHLGFKRIFEAPVKLSYNESDFTHAIGFGVLWRSLLDAMGVVYRLRLLHYYDDSNKRKWIYDKELEMRVNI
ncbi:glycosyltransferase [Candidatus Parcubacteria bacterium]|nr:glycosyltransferase [Patescibacteria group bacterium]MBU4381060.1 glycosyltransferase [Patescibacteria group bacterium]MCG2689397.1 glycosyltransferase [Candidatus Parcubacteria bacterium]